MEKKIGENVSSGAEKVERIERERTRPQTDAPEKAQHERQPDGAGAKGAPSKKKETETAADYFYIALGQSRRDIQIERFAE